MNRSTGALGRIFVFLTLLITALGCDEARERPTSTAPVADRKSDTLVRRLSTAVDTVNPLLADDLGERQLAGYLFVPLVNLDQQLRPSPGVAASWELSPDGRVYRFKLDKRATFTDGSRVLASDVIFTLKKILEPASAAIQLASIFHEIDRQRTRVIDAQTVEIVFREPFAGNLIRFNRLFVVPEHVYAHGDVWRDFNTKATGSGPYVLADFARKKVEVVRRLNDWRKPAPIPRVRFEWLADDTVAWRAFTKGQLDETRLTSDMWLAVRTDPQYSPLLRRFYTLSYEAIAWNGRHPLFRDKRMRRALSLCIPTEAIIRDLYHGTARPLNGPFVPNGYGWNSAVAQNQYDPPRARRELAALGWIDRDGDGLLDLNGQALTFDIVVAIGNPTGQRLVQTVQSELRRIGVRVTITRLDDSALPKHLFGGSYEAAFVGAEMSPEPDPYSSLHSSQFAPGHGNFVFYSNAAADSLMASARKEMDRTRREALYRKLHFLLAEDQPYTWLLQVQDKWAVSRRVRGVSESDGYGLFRWYPGELSWSLR